VALVLSVLFHVIVLIALRFESPLGEPPTSPSPQAVREPAGTRIVQLRIVPEEESAIGAERERPPVEQPAARIVAPPVAGGPVPARIPETDGRDPVPTVAERISPRLGDRRLFATPAEELPEKPDALTVARNRVEDRLAAFNDSTAAADEAARRATDWTVKDGNGGRWGVSPGKIHLGGLTLPLPVGFAPPPGRREEYAERNRRWGDIQSQRGNEATRAVADDRIKAIRERADAQRDSARRAGSGGN
jgi:hypothetical protein